MNIRHLPLQFGLSLVLGMVGVVSGTVPAQAQSGNFSDITGTIITTSDVVGGFGAGGGAETVIAFSTDEIEDAVNGAASSVNELLATNRLPVVDTGGTPTPIPAAVQQNLAVVLTSTGNVDAAVVQIETGLVNAGANPTLARNLAFSLRGLTSRGAVEPAQFQAVIEAYNALINASSFEFLEEPPEELRAIQSVLSILLNAALANR